MSDKVSKTVTFSDILGQVILNECLFKLNFLTI